MRNKFFKIVDFFSFYSAAASLLFAITLSVYAFFSFPKSLNSNINLSSVTLESYASEIDGVDSDEVRRTIESAGYPVEVNNRSDQRELLGEIALSISNYASSTNQSEIDASGLSEYFRKSLGGIYNDKYEDFLRRLLQESSALASLGADYPKIKWDKFLVWFTESYVRTYESEMRRLELDGAVAAADRVLSFTIAGVALGFFFSFVFFTMILLLIQIEINTRGKAVNSAP